MPEVDGLRFVAIGAVLIYHIWYAATLDLAAYEPLAKSASWLLHVRHCDRGVELFFAISGFILGLPFANHYLGRAPAVGIGRYFRRRLTRLEPPYLIALAGIYLLAVLLRTSDAADPDFWTSFWLRLVYGYGLARQQFHSLNGVTWSLEIEVQFYLIAPLIAQVFRLPLLLRRILMLALIGGLHSVAAHVPYSDFTVLGFAQFFLAGFLLADLQVVSPPSLGSARLRKAADLLGFFGLLGFLWVPEKAATIWMIPWIMTFIVFGALRGEALRWLLSIPLLTVIGGMCYSIYLIHYPLMSILAGKLPLAGLGQWQASMMLAAATFFPLTLASLAFFLLIERPCMDPEWPRRLADFFRKRLRP